MNIPKSFSFATVYGFCKIFLTLLTKDIDPETIPQNEAARIPGPNALVKSSSSKAVEMSQLRNPSLAFILSGIPTAGIVQKLISVGRHRRLHKNVVTFGMALNQYVRLQTWRIRLPSFAQSNSIPSTNIIQVCGPDERGEICLRLPTQIVIRPHSFVISVDNINARMSGELLKTPAGLIILQELHRRIICVDAQLDLLLFPFSPSAQYAEILSKTKVIKLIKLQSESSIHRLNTKTAYQRYKASRNEARTIYSKSKVTQVILKQKNRLRMRFRLKIHKHELL